VPHSKEHLPEDILNSEQDPESIKDPLHEELNKVKESIKMNSQNNEKEAACTDGMREA
jgi:hypothetical protein